MDTRRFVLPTTDVQRLRPLLSIVERRQGGFRKAHLAALAGKLAACREVRPRAVPRDVVTMNSLICIESVDDGAVHELRLVYPGGCDAHGAYVSVFTQLGSSLLGSRLGEVVTLHSPRKQGWTVRAIRFQPEACGRLDF